MKTGRNRNQHILAAAIHETCGCSLCYTFRLKSSNWESRMIHCSELMLCCPVWHKAYKAWQTWDFVSPSARFWLEQTNPIFHICLFLYACREEPISNIKRFTIVRKLLVMMSNRHLLSESTWTGVSRQSACCNCERCVNASSNKPTNVIISAGRTDCVARLNLLLLNVIIFCSTILVQEN